MDNKLMNLMMGELTKALPDAILPGGYRGYVDAHAGEYLARCLAALREAFDRTPTEPDTVAAAFTAEAERIQDTTFTIVFGDPFPYPSDGTDRYAKLRRIWAERQPDSGIAAGYEDYMLAIATKLTAWLLSLYATDNAVSLSIAITAASHAPAFDSLLKDLARIEDAYRGAAQTCMRAFADEDDDAFSMLIGGAADRQGTSPAPSAGTKPQEKSAVNRLADLIDPKFHEKYVDWFDDDIAPYLVDGSADADEATTMRFRKGHGGLNKNGLYTRFAELLNLLDNRFRNADLAAYMQRNIDRLADTSVDSIVRGLNRVME